MRVEAAIIQALKLIDIPPEISIVLADRDGIEPKAPYLIIQIISTTNIGLPRKTVTHEENIIRETVFQTKEFDVAFTFHADTKGITHDWAQDLHTGIFADVCDWAFTKQGLGVVSCDDIMYQSQPVDGLNYKRAIMNMVLRAEIESDYIVNEMTRVNIEGQLIDDLAGKFGEVVVDIPFGY